MADSVNQNELDALIGHLGPSPTDHRYAVRLESRDGALFLRMIGTLLQPVPDEFIARLQELFRRYPAQRAVVDLSKCAFISSSAIGVLMEYFQASTSRGGQVLLIKPTDKILKLIDILGLTRFFLIVEDDVMALHYFSEQAKLRDEASPAP